MLYKSRPFLVVSDVAANITIPVKKNVITITDTARIFPAIHELQPCGILLDYNYIGKDIEPVLRRMLSNPFYSKIKIYCYKSNWHTKTDSYLKALGVQQFIYAETFQQPKVNGTAKILSRVLDGLSANKLATSN